MFDYIDGAAEDEFTYQANLTAFDQVTFARSLPDRPMGRVNLRTTLLGTPLAPSSWLRAGSHESPPPG